MLLESEGFEVVGEAAAPDSPQTSLRPDVVLLDVYLPDINGFEVAKQLMTNGDPPEIVLTSSRDPRDFGAMIEQSGAKGFISKAEPPGLR